MVNYNLSGLNKIAVGFFYEKNIDDKTIAYISHISVSQFHQGIGTKLIEVVLINYLPNTLFYLCALEKNKDALSIYEKLGFQYDHCYVETFSYNPHNFVRMSLKTMTDKLAVIDNSFSKRPTDEQESYFKPRPFR